MKEQIRVQKEEEKKRQIDAERIEKENERK